MSVRVGVGRPAVTLLGCLLAALASLAASSSSAPETPAVTEPHMAPEAPAPAAPAATAPRKDAPDPAAAGQISGSVSTPARQPVRGASIVVLHENGSDIYGTSTAEDGRYALRDLKTGAYSVLVMDPGGSILRKDRVNARPLFRNLVDFITAPAGSPRPHIPSPRPPGGEAPPVLDLSGLVVDADGSTIPEAWVTLVPMGAEAPSLRARTDAGGRFRLLRIPTGYYRIAARSLGHVTWSLGPLLFGEPGERSLRLRLLPFPLGHPQTPEDLLVPVDPVPPEVFEKEPSP